MMKAIPRENPVEKVLFLLKKLNTLTHEMDHMYGLVKDENTRKIVEQCDWIQNKPMLLAILALIFLILFYGSHDDPYAQAPFMQWIVYLIVMGQFCVAVVWCATFYLIQAPIVCKIQKKKQEEKKFAKKVADESSLMPYELTLATVPSPPVPKTEEEWVEEQIAYSKASIYYLVFAFISFISLCGPPHMQFFMFFWVLDYFRLPYGFVVMQAVTTAGETLAKIGFGAMLLAILWTSWSFWLFQSDANAFEAQSNTVYQAILWGIHNGMRGDLKYSWGPIPNKATGKSFPLRIDDENSLAFQWLLVLGYALVWRFVFIGILTATIVGAFAGIRGRAAALALDANERCLVCSISRFTLEQEGGGFSHHTTNHHNPWSFLAFLAALKLGNEDNFTGIESYVHKKSKAGDHTFFPVSFCTEIQSGQRRATAAVALAAASTEKDADGANDMQKRIMKALDGITSATNNLKVDLPQDMSERLDKLEKAMESVTDVVSKLG